MTILEAVRTNDRKAALIALRDKLAETLDSKDSARDVASNSKRLMEVLGEIEALSNGDGEDDPVEAMRKKRAR